jgi:hypothetical protein
MPIPTFKLNEAPDIALNAIKSHDTTRTCGSLWSWLCCVPTCGFSRYWDEISLSAVQSEFDGCFPIPLKMEQHAALDTLREALQNLKGSKKESTPGLLQPEDVNQQVLQTLNVLNAALQTEIQSGYRRAIQTAVNQIKAKQAKIAEYEQKTDLFLQAATH